MSNLKVLHQRLLTLVASFALLLMSSSASLAGGPLLIRSSGTPYVWNTAAPIIYRTDNGPLSASVDEATARGRLLAMFNVWQDVTTSSISYARATTAAGNGVGFIGITGAFAGGDVDTVVEYDAVLDDCGNGNQSPVIYDVDATLFIDLGLDETLVIGFAGPCSINGTQFVAGQVVMNGLFQDGAMSPVVDLTAARFDAALIHEIGHFSGLDHSQINLNCVVFCGADDLAGLPTMFPLLIDASQGALSPDDIAWISRLYPQTGAGTTFAGTHGTITGSVFFSDGQSHAKSVNVIARRVDAGGNEDRRIAVSVISGFKFTSDLGNPILNLLPSSFGTILPGDIGLYEIPVPAGSYTIEVESIDPEFVDGSSIGDVPIAMPGTAPPPTAPIAVAAGATVTGINVTLIGTDPRFDHFEGP
jgi:hypothetical protein